MAAVKDVQNASSIASNRLRSIASCISSHFDNGSLTFAVVTIVPRSDLLCHPKADIPRAQLKIFA